MPSRESRKKVLVILGPTASGKSDLAVQIAKKLNGEIISADSRQVYKYLNIGTGKITKKEMGGIKHYLLDIADPKKQFSVNDFKIKAKEALKLIEANEALPVIVGGTGFYIDAVTGTTNFPEVPPNKALRKKLEKMSVEELFDILKKKDPERAETIDQHNKVRLVRALEIVEALGHVPKANKASRATDLRSFAYIGLKPDDLEERIYKRLIKRMPGMIKEARKLIKLRKLSYKRMHELGLEYRFLAMYLQGKLSREEMFEKLNIAINQYAKRQMTWFKRNKKIKWFKPGEYEKIEKFVWKTIKKS